MSAELDASERSGGSYEVIRARLLKHAAVLRERAQKLNTERSERFGGQELRAVKNLRVRTENNCIPCDIAQVQGHLLFGFNVFMGLKPETTVPDVLTLHHLATSAEEVELSRLSSDSPSAAFLSEGAFVNEFTELYRFYKETRLAQLVRQENKLLAIFRIGQRAEDKRVFRWALGSDGAATYIDNRGERDHLPPPQHDFEWTLATRNDQVSGRHPHVSILGEVFVETVGGDLTIKVENNTESGEGILSEPVAEPRQTLDDAEYSYARLGALILLRILPYNEQNHRYFVFDIRTRRVARIDAIGLSCVQLPEDHGIIFPGGHFLPGGESKVFDGDFSGFTFERTVRSPNGEDVLYVFHRVVDGAYRLLSYNLIRKELQTPLLCHGYSLFEDGAMVVFKAGDEPTRVHVLQLWSTPFVSAEHAAKQPEDHSPLGRIGNAELVRGISDVLTIVRDSEAASTRQGFEDLVAGCVRALDGYYWLGQEEVFNLAAEVKAVRESAERVLDEFDKVVEARRIASEALAQAKSAQEALIASLRLDSFTGVAQFMSALADLRRQRGHLISLKETRYIDLEALSKLERQVVHAFEATGSATAQFLLRPDALAPVVSNLEDILQQIETAQKTPVLVQQSTRLERVSEGLNVLSDVVASLQTDDPTDRTRILQHVSEVFAHLNRVRATETARRKELITVEGQAEFGAQFALFAQTLASALTAATTVSSCDDQLSRLLVQLEELEARFSEFDDFVVQLAVKRDEVYETFTQRRQSLLDRQQARGRSLEQAAARIVQSIARRADSFKNASDLNAYFASDAMVLKVHQIAEQLKELGDATRSDEVESKLKTARQNALRALRDKSELFAAGENVIQLGDHLFNINTQALELTLLPEEKQLVFSLTGTDFREPVTDARLTGSETFWTQSLASENATVYRAEYLAASLLFAAEDGAQKLSLQALRDALREERLLTLVQAFAADRYSEGYERGVHDTDAARILEQLLPLYEASPALRFTSVDRALAGAWWWLHGQTDFGQRLLRQARSFKRMHEHLGGHWAGTELEAELTCVLQNDLKQAGFTLQGGLQGNLSDAARFLIGQLGKERFELDTARAAAELATGLRQELERRSARRELEQELAALEKAPAQALELATHWCAQFATAHAPSQREFASEAGLLLLSERQVPRSVTSARVDTTVADLLGSHPRIIDRQLNLRLDEFLARLGRFAKETVPAYNTYRALRQVLIEEKRHQLRLEEFKPRVLSSFVRNRLVSEVYLPLIGANFAKQLGAAGAKKRTDLMGLLLLISPPGYGKTTLMEYVANRLGLVFVKVNGPALGHSVLSLDPSEAPNKTAQQEVEKLNFALELGNNVMLYLDDIQHTNPEFLQKFISLCDAQRRIEGVWKGRTRTYDLRGKKFCVVMAGNPYTESGEKFQIPDMLSNRADTYNLGDVLAGRDDVFALSYLENALTSNPVLAPLSLRSPRDVHTFLRMASDPVGQELPALEHAYSAAESDDITRTFRLLMAVQRIVLRINMEYIASASMDDSFRTEPAFKLQGSYRNMAKLAEKVAPAMNDAELQALLDDHYTSEAQTLTTGAEHNLLKLAELRGRLTPEQTQRWEDIKRSYQRERALGGQGADSATRLIGQLGQVGEQIAGIREVIALSGKREQPPWVAAHMQRLESAIEQLRGARFDILVKNEPPPGIGELLTQQVDILEKTLVPFLRVATERLDDSLELRKRLDTFIAELRTVDGLLRRQSDLGPKT